MNKIKIAMLLLFLNFNFLSAAGQKKDPISWSVFQGKKSWEDAKNHCSGMGMRLPALSEIKQSIELGTTKEWEKNGSRFWSAERGDLFWTQDPQYGEAETYKSISLTGAEEFHRPESELGVFCINQSTIKFDEDTINESRVFYPESFTTKTGIKLQRFSKKMESQSMCQTELDQMKKTPGTLQEITR
jgi:hypothetical protein